MSHIARTTSFAALLSSAAIFGFFYAWVCSTMWGLDTLSPGTAIAAMQAMNASVRNAVFAPAFFGTGPILLLAAAFSWMSGGKRAAYIFAAAGIAYILGGMILTMAVNVPMNEALGLVDLGVPAEQLAAIWSDYSPKWQFWNQVRTIVSGLVVLMTGWGIVEMTRDAK